MMSKQGLWTMKLLVISTALLTACGSSHGHPEHSPKPVQTPTTSGALPPTSSEEFEEAVCDARNAQKAIAQCIGPTNSDWSTRLQRTILKWEAAQGSWPKELLSSGHMKRRYPDLSESQRVCLEQILCSQER